MINNKYCPGIETRPPALQESKTKRRTLKIFHLKFKYIETGVIAVLLLTKTRMQFLFVNND